MIFCPCGRPAYKNGFCKRHIKYPPKPKNEKRGQFRGKSKWAEENKMFEGAWE